MELILQKSSPGKYKEPEGENRKMQEILIVIGDLMIMITLCIFQNVLLVLLGYNFGSVLSLFEADILSNISLYCHIDLFFGLLFIRPS